MDKLWNVITVTEDYDKYIPIQEVLQQKLNTLSESGNEIFSVMFRAGHGGYYYYEVIYKSKQAIIKELLNE